MSTPLIRVDGLTYRYAGATQPALDGVDLAIEAGSSFGLLGPNGAGKTTLLSLLTGLLPPQQGTLHIAGFDPAHEPQRIRALTGLVPQELAFYPALSGRENLKFFADVHGISPAQWSQRLEYCVQVCRLDEVLDQQAARYSGGLKRRLNLAIGLLHAPRILYLDEPTAGIDARSRQVIVAAIKALREGGTTLVYTSHYMEEIEAICDTIAVIDHGRVVAHGPTADLARDAEGSSQPGMGRLERAYLRLLEEAQG
ncbi:MAG: ABC transporter ATP-binding protein [Pseudomonadota bacterium]